MKDKYFLVLLTLVITPLGGADTCRVFNGLFSIVNNFQMICFSTKINFYLFIYVIKS